MRPSHSRFVLLVLVALTSACGASAKGSTASDGASVVAEDGGKASSKPGAVAAAAAAGKPLTFASVSPRRVTSMMYSGPRLAVGFDNGAFALVAADGSAESASGGKSFAVSAVSPNGQLALLSSSPPVIVNGKGDLILQMNTVPDFESAAFGNDGITLYVAAKDGKIRIWGQPHSFEEDQHKEKLENYLNRQAPDFLIELSPIRGPIHVTDDGTVVAVDKEGAVRLWNPMAPSSSKRVMKVGGGARSIASSGDYVFVTSLTGVMKIGKTEGGYLPWTKETRAAFVGATGVVADAFFTLDKGVLKSLKTETGEEIWSTTVPSGHPCGLAVSPDGGTVAACVGDFIATFDANTGSPTAYGYQADGKFEWNK